MNRLIVLTFLTVFLFSCDKGSMISDGILNFGDFELQEMAFLPSVLKESSGLEMASNGDFYSFNDSGGAAEVYQFDLNGELKATLKLSNATNNDWEDICLDQAGNMYVGNFGNNNNERTNLSIFKIASDDLGFGSGSVTTSRIDFHFPDQYEFPPASEARFFDVESLFAKGNYLYILTKDRSQPFVGKTTLYRLPKESGNYGAEYLNEFYTDTNKGRGQINAADISPDGRTLAMISNEILWLFTNFSEDDFFGGEVTQIDLPIQKDMEGLVFKDDCTIYMSNEQTSKNDAILYELRLCL